jgi:hypothetical protein
MTCFGPYWTCTQESLYNPGTGWAATDPTFTRKSTHFLFHAVREGGKHWLGLRPVTK